MVPIHHVNAQLQFGSPFYCGEQGFLLHASLIIDTTETFLTGLRMGIAMVKMTIVKGEGDMMDVGSDAIAGKLLDVLRREENAIRSGR